VALDSFTRNLFRDRDLVRSDFVKCRGVDRLYNSSIRGTARQDVVPPLANKKALISQGSEGS
jgi:hypothetical protein